MAKVPALPHISRIGLQNFRAFKKELDIPLAPLTFLVGPNSGGKSSLFSSTLFLAQSFSWPPVNPWPQWTGTHVDLGSFRDAVYGHGTTERMHIRIRTPLVPRAWFRRRQGTTTAQLDYEFEFASARRPLSSRLVSVSIADVISGHTVALRLTTGRQGPGLTIALRGIPGTKKLGPRSREMRFGGWQAIRRLSNTVGEVLDKGKAAAGVSAAAIRRLKEGATGYPLDFLFETAQRVTSARTAPERAYPRAVPKTTEYWQFPVPVLIKGVDPLTLPPEKWPPQRPFTVYDLRLRRGSRRRRETVDRVLHALRIARAIKRSELSPYHSRIQLRDSSTGIWCNLVDVGYGASQIIPVIQACLTPVPGPLFVEQPEIHLHPKAQAVVADLLAETSRSRQVLVETHSVHLINRVRLLIADKTLGPEHVIVNYVSRKRDGSHVETIRIDKNGDFDKPWPQGFFDERYQDTLALMRLKADKRERE